jgi:hypothetical protein
MPHHRQLIRAAAVDMLTGQTDAGSRVYRTRSLPVRKIPLPAISVYTLEELVTPESVDTAPRELTRELPLLIEGWVRAGENVDDAMDELAVQIEAAMHADPYLRDTAAESILDSTVMEVIEDGDREMGLIVLTYAVTYRTLAPEAPTNLDEFLTAPTKYRVPGTTDANDAEDLIDVREAAP